MNLRTVVIIALTIFSCQEKSNKETLTESEITLERLEKGLQVCRSKSIDSVLTCSKSTLSDLLKNKDSKPTLSKVWLNYGVAEALIQNGFLNESLPYIEEALPITEEYQFRLEQAKLFGLRAKINTELNNSLEAASDLYQSADLYISLEKFTDAAACYLSTCNLQYNSGNYQMAIDNARQSLDYFSKNPNPDEWDSLQHINLFNTLGLANFQLDKLDSASKYFDQSSQYAISLDNKLWIGLVTGNSAKIDIAKGDNAIAIKKLQQKFTVSLENKEYSAAGSALIILADIEVKANNLSEAKNLYDSAWSLINKEKRPRSWAAYYQSVSNWYEQMGNYKEANTYTKKYLSLRDSTQGSNPISSQLLQLQNNNKFKKQLADLSLLRAENEVKNQELKVSQISILAIIVISILLIVLLITIHRNYKKLNTLNSELESKVRTRTGELLKLNKELDTYLYRSSHDVRRPILSIIGLTQLTTLVKGEDELREIQGKIDDTARAMDRMLQKLQMAYEIDKIEEFENIEISDYVKGIVFTTQRIYPDIAFDFKSSAKSSVQANPKLLDIIFNNLLENACIFSTPQRPKVSIDIEKSIYAITVRISDNGIGIDKSYWSEIFKPYTRFSERSVGSGLGLHLAEKSLRKMNGTIEVNSTLYKGSEFTVSIPLESSL